MMSRSEKERNTSFLELHFGNDLLISAWLLFFSASIAFGLFSDNLIQSIIDKKSMLRLLYDSLIFASGFVYAMAGYIFLIASYEENIAVPDPSKFKLVKDMTCTEKYFTGNNLLIMSWLLFLATIPILSFPIIEFIEHRMIFEVFIFLTSAICFALLNLILWVIACFPESMAHNNGRGSSYVYDCFRMVSMACCAASQREGVSDDGFITDFLLVSWVIAIASFLSIPVAIYMIYANVTPAPWLMLISDILFAMGSALFVYAFTPDNHHTSIVWHYMTCCCAKETDMTATSREERDAILRHAA
mmetsp:Transcript_28445/g.28765  ORF Transcript_28445/g.28765 Transcript_28445/m.28765 type:complete len:302 (+) Transcript_28445:87-992(+)